MANLFIKLIEPIIKFFEEALALLGIELKWPELCVEVDVPSISVQDLAEEIGGQVYEVPSVDIPNLNTSI